MGNTSTVVTIKFLNTKTKKYTTKKYRCVVKAAVEEKKIASAIESASAVGAKTVKVVFDGDLTTTSGVAISVKKGTTELNKDSVTFNDSKTATVTLKTGLTTGTYTAVATGVVSGSTLTKDFSVESEEYVASIELSSKKAPMTGTSDPTNKEATITYVMKNQYREVVSNSAAPNFIVSTGMDATSTYKNGVGTAKISKPTAFIPGDTVYVNAVLTNGTHVATLSDSVEIVLPASFDRAEIAGVYNKTLKKMDTITSAKLNDGSYVYQILFTAYDQYDNIIDADKAAEAAEFTALSTNPIFVGLNATPTTAEVDGKSYVALTLTAGDRADKGGTATIQLISTKTGTKSTYDIVADAAGAVDRFTLSAPAEYAVVGEKLEIPFEAYDQNGNAITDYKSLAGSDIIDLNASSGNGMKFVQKSDGSAKLVADLSGITIASEAKSVPVYLSSVVKSNGYYSSATITVQLAAVPTSVLGLKSDSKIATTVLATVAQDIDYTKLSIGDQYGRVMKDTAVKTYMDANSMVIYCYSDKDNGLFTVIGDDITDLTTVNGAATTQDNNADCGLIYAASGNKFTVTAATSDTKDTEKLTFGLGTLATTNLKTNSASEKSITFTTSAAKEFVKYEVDDLATLHYVSDTNAGADVQSSVDSDDAVTPAVYGVKADGTKVKLQTADYEITTNAKTDALATADGKISQKDKTSTKYKNADFQVSPVDTTHKSIELKAFISIKDADHGSIVTTIEKKLVLDNAKPKVVAGKFNSKVSDGTVYVSADDLKGYDNLATAFVDTLLDKDTIKDQYGIKNSLRDTAETYTISISNVKDATSTKFSYNGTKVTAATAGDTFTINIKYAEGYTLSVNVIVE